MPRQVGRTTAMPGVYYLGNKRFRIRAQVRRQGKKPVECDRVIRAESVREAALIRQKAIEEILEYRQPLPPKLQASPTGDEQKGSESEKQKKPEETAIDRASKRPLEKCADAWLKGKKQTAAPSTRERYVNAVTHITESSLGSVRICDLTTEMMEEWRDEKAKEMASSTVNGHLAILKTIVGRASRAGRLGYDPSVDVESLPGGDERTNQDEPNALNEKEFVEFIKAARVVSPRHFPVILTLLTTGMRPGSARALRVEDLNQPERGLIMVRRRVSAGELRQGVKRGLASWDEVPLHPVLAEVLRIHIAGFSPAQRKSGLLFPNRTGQMWASTWLRKPFIQILKHAGIDKRFTPQGCRRTANDFYRRVSSEVVTMAITGHVTKRMHKHYSTVSREEKIGASSEAFDGVLDKKPEDAQVLYLTPKASA